MAFYWQGEDIEITLTPDPADANLSTATTAVIRIHYDDDNSDAELVADVSADTFVATLPDTVTELHTGKVTVQGYAVYPDGTRHYTDQEDFKLKVPITV